MCICCEYREKAQYCYKNLTTDEVTWEYPDRITDSTAVVADGTMIADDEMDISTTPPPNVDEDLQTSGRGTNRERHYLR